MKNLPHVLTREESGRLRERISIGRQALHHTSSSVEEVIEKVIPAGGFDKLDYKRRHMSDADVLKIFDQMEKDLNHRSSVEVVIAIEPTIKLERAISAWASKITQNPVILSIISDARIGAGVVAYIDGNIYDKSLNVSIQSYGELQ